MGTPQAASKPRVFLSYSRRDSAFVDELVISLESYGFEVVFDRADLFPGEPWEPRLQRLITDAETTVCVVSKSWIASEQCSRELGIAVQNGRRVIPAIIDPVNPSEMPEHLARLQFVFFHGAGHSYARGVATLVETLRTDIGWMREQSRLLDKADEWVSQDRSPTLLIRGVALERALAWLAGPPPRDTRVVPLVTEFIEASRAGQDSEEKRRLRNQRNFTAVALAACLFFLIGVGSLGYIAYTELQAREVDLERTEGELTQANVELGEVSTLYDLTVSEPVDEPPPPPPPRSEDDTPDDPAAGPPADVVEDAGPEGISAEEAARLATALNSTDRSERLRTGETVAGLIRQGDTQELLPALASQLAVARFEALSPSGRVNMLYMLNGYVGWPDHALRSSVSAALDAIDARASEKGSSLLLGAQARGCIATLRNRIAGRPAAGCGA